MGININTLFDFYKIDEKIKNTENQEKEDEDKKI